MTITPYECNTSDLCVQGYERLRSRDEFMITIPVWRGITAAEIRDAMKADIQSYMQPEWFDYDAANAGIDAFCEGLRMHLFADLEETEEGEEGCYLFTYWQAPVEVPVIQF